MAENLWPNFIVGEPIITPASIMKEQADLFNEKMQGKLLCFINSAAVFLDSSKVETKMFVSAPNFGNYSMRLLTVRYPLINSFPCSITNEITSTQNDEISNVADFKAVLMKELAQPEVMKVIQVLYSQVTTA